MNAYAIDYATDYAGRVITRRDTVTHRPNSLRIVRGRVVELSRTADGRSWATLMTAEGEATHDTIELALFN